MLQIWCYRSRPRTYREVPLWDSFMISGLYLTYEIRAEKVSGGQIFSVPSVRKGGNRTQSRSFHLVRLYFLVKKSARVSPVPFGRGHRDAQDFSRFLERQADEVTQLGQLSFFGVLGGQFVEC